MTSNLASEFRAFGFVVLRRYFDPAPLGAEVDHALAHGIDAEFERGGAIRFQYVPMMTAETPQSLSLLDRASVTAAELLGGDVLPTRAKGTRYFGNTPWHMDSDMPLDSVGVLAYLDAVDADSGALRVLPGSHHPSFRTALDVMGAAGLTATELPGHVLASEPGDLIFMDERLFHASTGGGVRRQWRLDFLRVPADDDAERRTRAYFADLFTPDWDGGYDVERFPSYGPDWQASGRPAVAQLKALGVYEHAARQEAFTAARRPRTSPQPETGDRPSTWLGTP
jgi:hypothetical protein